MLPVPVELSDHYNELIRLNALVRLELVVCCTNRFDLFRVVVSVERCVSYVKLLAYDQSKETTRTTKKEIGYNTYGPNIYRLMVTFLLEDSVSFEQYDEHELKAI